MPSAAVGVVPKFKRVEREDVSDQTPLLTWLPTTLNGAVLPARKVTLVVRAEN